MGRRPALGGAHRAAHVVRRAGLGTLLREACEAQAVAPARGMEDARSGTRGLRHDGVKWRRSARLAGEAACTGWGWMLQAAAEALRERLDMLTRGCSLVGCTRFRYSCKRTAMARDPVEKCGRCGLGAAKRSAPRVMLQSAHQRRPGVSESTPPVPRQPERRRRPPSKTRVGEAGVCVCHSR